MRPMLDFPLLCFRGDVWGEAVNMERFGSIADEVVVDIVLELPSAYESARL